MAQRKSTRRDALALLGERRSGVALVGALSLVGGFAEAAFLLLITKTGFTIASGAEEVGLGAGVTLDTTSAVLLAAALATTKLLATLWSTWLTSSLWTGAVADVRRRLSRAFLHTEWSVQHDEPPGKLQELLTTYTTRAADLVFSVIQFVSTGLTLGALLILAVAVDPAGSLVVVLAIAAIGMILRPLRSVLRRQAGVTAESGMEFATALNETSELGLEVQVFRVHGVMESRLERLVAQNAEQTRRLSNLRGVLPALYTGMAYLALVIALAVLTQAQAESASSLGAVMVMMLRSLTYGQSLQAANAQVAVAGPFLDGLMAELDRYESQAVVGRGSPVGSVGNLDLREVSFAYPGGPQVLSDVSVTIEPHEIVGIIGPSGSGKSTLVQLLLGLRHPTSGDVLSAGRPVASLDRDEWARLVTFVPQRSQLVHGTIEDNIRFFRPDVTRAEVIEAAKLAHLHEDVEQFDDGYGRAVGERGGQLSGGQQQRVCLARALVEKPQLLVLDEPTSSLDVRSETLVRETLTALRSRMSVVIIAHRMSTLEICDRIMVIQNGRVVACGAPAELEASNRFYRQALELSGLR